MESLFDSSSVKVVKAGNGLVEAWKVWCLETARPRQLSPDKKFSAAYKKAIGDNMSHTEIIKIVKNAAFLPPRPRDPSDVRRVTMSLTNRSLRKQAENLAAQGEPKFLFAVKEKNMSFHDLGILCGIEWHLWSVDECEYADLVCEMDEKIIIKAVAITKEYTNSDVVLPSDIIKKKRIWVNGSTGVKRMDGRRVHDRGTEELDEWSDIALDVDSVAQKMFLKGVPHDVVLEFHNLAPKGFWDSVKDGVVKGLSLKEATEWSENKFGWDIRRLK